MENLITLLFVVGIILLVGVRTFLRVTWRSGMDSDKAEAQRKIQNFSTVAGTWILIIATALLLFSK